METFSALLALCAETSPVTGEFPHKGQWRRALMLLLICAWINSWINNRDAGDLRRHRAHYDVTVMIKIPTDTVSIKFGTCTSNKRSSHCTWVPRGPNYHHRCTYGCVCVACLYIIKISVACVNEKEYFLLSQLMHFVFSTKFHNLVQFSYTNTGYCIYRWVQISLVYQLLMVDTQKQIDYSPETHLKVKSRDISFIHNTHYICPVVWNVAHKALILWD